MPDDTSQPLRFQGSFLGNNLKSPGCCTENNSVNEEDVLGFEDRASVPGGLILKRKRQNVQLNHWTKRVLGFGVGYAIMWCLKWTWNSAQKAGKTGE